MTAVITRGEPWLARARCTGMSSWFFPEGDDARARHRQAIRVCAGCPVIDQCLRLAMDAEGRAPAGSRYGVFGGLTPAQRREMYEARVRRVEAVAS